MSLGPVPAQERFELPEALSRSETIALARTFRTHYIGARFPQLSPDAIASSEDRTEGRVEFRWPLGPDDLGPGSALPARGGITLRVVFEPHAAVVEFSGPEPMDPEVRRALSGMADEIHAFVARYLRIERSSSLYVAAPAGGVDSSGPSTPSGSNEAARRIFSGNSTNLILLIVVLSVPAVLILGLYAFVLMIALQGLVLAFADRLAAASGFVRPSPARPSALVVGVTAPPGREKDLRRAAKKVRPMLRARLSGIPPSADPSTAVPVVVAALGEVGIASSAADIEVTRRDVYARVESVARRFALPMPKIVVTDQPMSNAAATGISPRHATIAITAGSVEQLTDDQLEAVIGHEFGHIRGRDPIVLFGLTAVLYLGAIFLWLPVLLYLGLFYFVLAFVLLYVAGKTLETRADTLSAIVIGRPADLARSLEAAAFEEEYLEERSYAARVFGWLSFDSHPPLYFRVRRLFRIARGRERIGHPYLASARDCAIGFVSALAGRD